LEATDKAQMKPFYGLFRVLSFFGSDINDCCSGSAVSSTRFTTARASMASTKVEGIQAVDVIVEVCKAIDVVSIV
jgi:hypothetical protein